MQSMTATITLHLTSCKEMEWSESGKITNIKTVKKTMKQLLPYNLGGG